MQEAARGRDVRVIRTVAIVKAKDAHLVDEFCGWDAASEDYPAGLLATVRSQLDYRCRECPEDQVFLCFNL